LIDSKLGCNRRARSTQTLDGLHLRETILEVQIMNSQSSLQELEERTRKLERRLKLLICAWLLTVGVIFVSAATLQTKSETIENLHARQITIVDEKGTERMYIGSPVPDPMMGGKRQKRRSTDTGIVLNDAAGNETGGFGVLDDGTMSACIDYKGYERLCTFFLPSGRSGLLIEDENQKDRVALGLNEAGQSELLLNDGTGKPRARLQVDKDGKTKLEMIDEKGRPTSIIREQKKKSN
jgi:hypothetical protein